MKKNDLSKYRFDSAFEKLEAAKLLRDNGFYRDSLSRSYYAIFTGARALLALKELDSSKHSGIISMFNLHFVKEGLVNKVCSKIISSAQIHRQRSDYGDYVIASKEEANEQIFNAEIFLQEIQKYLDLFVSKK